MSHILLVEDDPVLGRGLLVNLELEGYRVTWARDLKSAFAANEKTDFHLVILDLGLPDGSGLSFCMKLRERNSRIPVIMLTAQTDEDSVVEGLNCGATDYVRKPFGGRELLARVKTALKETVTREHQIRYGDLLVLEDQRKVFADGQELEFNRREFDLLYHLAKNAEVVVSRENLIAALGRESEIFDRTIDSHLSHIRAKLRTAGVVSVQITSVYGVGYRLEKK